MGQQKLALPSTREILEMDALRLREQIEQHYKSISALQDGILQQQRQIDLLNGILEKKRELEAAARDGRP